MSLLRWHTDRLRAMPVAELVWRCRRRVRRAADRLLLRARGAGPNLRRLVDMNSRGFRYGPTAFAADHPEWRRIVRACSREETRARLTAGAETLLAHRFDIFDRGNVFLGDEIHWNYEPKAEKRTPLGPSSAIDEHDYRETGDARWVWETNRHHHFVILARAHFLTGDLRFAREIIEQTQSWTTQCPYGHGMNWLSPLELSVRLINWAHAWELIRPSGLITQDVEERVLPVVYRHLWEIQRNYSWHGSAVHRLIVEAAGVFIGASYFGGFRASGRWRERARSILERQIIRQSHDDGGHVELSTGNHLFALECLLYAGLVARRSGRDFSQGYWKRLERMMQFVAILTDGGKLPVLGDSDESYVLDLGGRSDRAAAMLSVGAWLFDHPEWASTADEIDEPAAWLLARAPEPRTESRAVERSSHLTSQALKESGYYLLQVGSRRGPKSISVIVDCGPLGHGGDAAHGHADALSLILRIGGYDVLVDPGAYDYFTYPEWRRYFRGTSAHNTLVIDGVDQSELCGPFRWGRRAAARCLRWSASSTEASFIGEHNGYLALTDPVIQRRSVTLSQERATVVVKDEVEATQEHEVSSYWHLAETCQASPLGKHAVRIDHPAGVAIMEFADFFAIRLVRGLERPPEGWVSRGYHRKTPSLVIVAHAVVRGGRAWETRIDCQPARVDGRPRGPSRPERKVVRAAAS